MRIGRVYRSAAVGAKGVGAFVAAFGSLDVDLGSSGSQNETGCRRLYIDSIGRARERLAISAVTNPHSLRVDLGFKSTLSAVATAFDFHGRPRERIKSPGSADYRASIAPHERPLARGPWQASPACPPEPDAYQILTRSDGAKYILSPGMTLKASYHASMLRVEPITRNCLGECSSLTTWLRRNESETLPRQACA